MIKIIHVITCLNTGGAEMMLTKLVAASSLAEETHIVISLMGKGTLGDQVSKHAKLYSLGLKSGGMSFSALVKLFKIIKKENPDVIQGWMYHANIAALLVNCVLRKVLVWNIRQSLVDIKLEKRLTALLIRVSSLSSFMVDKVIFNSHVSLSQHIKAGFTEKNVIVIANGFELDKFKELPVEQIISFKKEYGIPTQSQIIGHVARYHPMKNHIGFVKLMSEVLLAQESVYCVMAGKDINEDNIELVNAISEGKCEHRFILLGERSDLASIYGIFDFTVNSSLWGEAFPNVIGESMACGTPCIVSDVGDSMRIVGDFGFVYTCDDDRGLVSHLESALNMGGEEYSKKSSLCKSHISENYSINAIYEQYVFLYKQLMDNK